MALIGNVIADAFGGNPSLVNYDMFVVVFAMLCLFYLIFVAIKEDPIVHPLLPLVLDVLNTLFWFVAAVAMAAELHVHSCSNSVSDATRTIHSAALTILQAYTKSNHLTNGASNEKKRCQELQASTAFFWFGFVCFAASCFFSAIGSRGSGVNMRSGGIRKGGPAMSQV